MVTLGEPRAYNQMIRSRLDKSSNQFLIVPSHRQEQSVQYIGIITIITVKLIL